MSKHVTSLVYSRKAGSLLRKAVLAYMADVANHDGTGIWSSKQRIADEIEASRRGVLDAIKGLIADGILIENGKRRCKNGYTIEYSIDLDVVAQLPDMPHNIAHPGKSAQVQDVPPTPEPDASDPGTGCHQTVHNQIEPAMYDAREILDRCLSAMGLDMNAVAGSAGLLNVSPIINLIRPAQGIPADFEADVLPNLMAAKGRNIRTWEYFRAAILESRDRRLQGNPEPTKRATSSAPRAKASREPARNNVTAAVSEILAERRALSEHDAYSGEAEPIGERRLEYGGAGNG